jgi:hypothetical protein
MVMKTMKNYRIVFTALTIILSALLVTACISAIPEYTAKEKEDVGSVVNLPAGKGAIFLKFSDDSRVTIAPEEDYENLNFTVAVSSDDDRIIFEKNVKMSKDEAETIPIILDEGDYTVSVFGYYKTSDKPAYAGEVETSVASGGTKGVPIKLKGIVDEGGQGTFSYKITFPGGGQSGGEAATGSLYVETIEGVPALTRLDLKNGYSTQIFEESDIILASGYYRIRIEYGGTTGYQSNTITWILHIYPAMPTHFDCPLPALLKSYYTVTYDANGGLFANSQSEYSDSVSLGGFARELFGDDRPNREGYSLVAWTESGHIWEFYNWRVWEDITLVARWEEEEGEIEVIYDPDLEGGNGGGKVFILGDSLEKIMKEENKNSYLAFEIIFLRDIDIGDESINYFLKGNAEFGHMYSAKGTYPNFSEVDAGPGGWVRLAMNQLNEGVQWRPYEEGEIIKLRLKISVIQDLFKDYFDEKPGSGFDPHNPMEALIIKVQFDGFIELTGRLYIEN